MAVINTSLLRRSQGDIDSPAIGAPALQTRFVSETLIRKGDALIVLLPIAIRSCPRQRIADLPEALDEFLAVCLIRQSQKGVPLILGNDVGDLLFDPLLVARREPLARFVSPCFGAGEEGQAEHCGH